MARARATGGNQAGQAPGMRHRVIASDSHSSLAPVGREAAHGWFGGGHSQHSHGYVPADRPAAGPRRNGELDGRESIQALKSIVAKRQQLDLHHRRRPATQVLNVTWPGQGGTGPQAALGGGGRGRECSHQDAVTIQSTWRGFLARQRYVRKKRSKSLLESYRKQMGAASLLGWAEVVSRRRQMRALVNERFVWYGKWVHHHLGREFDGEAVLREEGQAGFADCFRSWRSKATVFLAWMEAAVCNGSAGGQGAEEGGLPAPAASKHFPHPRRRRLPSSGRSSRSPAEVNKSGSSSSSDSFARHVLRVLGDKSRGGRGSSSEDGESDG
mmetsp:Transcript_38361/g.108428  ORF Transcript_38361/g.108428 Transcript_38361/m.108428 type:complete len:327 (-) Transcript_38361:175-1155(-)